MNTIVREVTQLFSFLPPFSMGVGGGVNSSRTEFALKGAFFAHKEAFRSHKSCHYL